MNPVGQLQTTSFPFNIKHCPPFWQTFNVDGQNITLELVVGAIVVVVNVEISQNDPFWRDDCEG